MQAIVNKYIIENLKKENTKISKRVLNFLNKDRLLIVVEKGGGFYLETTSRYFNIPNYVYDYLIKKGRKILKTYYYNDKIFFINN